MHVYIYEKCYVYTFKICLYNINYINMNIVMVLRTGPGTRRRGMQSTEDFTEHGGRETQMMVAHDIDIYIDINNSVDINNNRQEA